MAISVSEANAVSAEGFDKTLTQIVFEDSPFFTKMKQDNKIKRDGGRDIRFGVRYDALSAADAVDPSAQAEFNQKDTRTEGVLNWKYYLGQTMMNWDERVKNSGSKYQKINLIKEKTAELKEDFYNRLATDLYTSNSNGNGIVALPTIVDATDSYAGISPSDATNWASAESASVTLTLFSGANSLAYMVAQATFGKKAPTIHVTTRNLQNKFESLMYTSIQYRDKKMANAGFDNITFRGAPVIGDAHCTSKAWYGLCTDEMEVIVHSDYDMKVSEWMDADIAGYVNTLIKTMTANLNIVCKNRRTQFKYTALVHTN